MFGNLSAQAGIIASNLASSPNIIIPALTWDFSGIPIFDFEPRGPENVNDRPRINVWRDVNGQPDFNYLTYISGGKDVLSPAPTGRFFQPWGDRSTGIYNFPITAVTYIRQIFSGEQAGDSFGNSVDFDLNGNVICIGSFANNTPTGSIFIYRGNRRLGWNLERKLLPEINNTRYLGLPVKINLDGNIIITRSESFNSFTGYFSIYTGNSDGQWNFKQNITGETFSDIETFTISNDNSIIAIGRPNLFLNSGAIDIYTGNINNGWNFRQRITGQQLNLLGSAFVEISNSNNIIFTSIGRVRTRLCSGINIYTGSINNGWFYNKTISTVPNINFGCSFGTNDNLNTLAIGASQASGINFTGGAVYIYTGGQNLNWFLSRIIAISGQSNLTNFGASLSLNNSGDILNIGSPGDFENGVGAGAAYTFLKNQNNNWILEDKFLGRTGNSAFGTSLKLAKDGSLTLIGSNVTNNTTPNLDFRRGYAVINNRATPENREIIGGIDVFTHDWAPISDINPPLYLWSVNRGIQGEIKYAYRFIIGEKNPGFRVTLRPLPECIPLNIPNCNQGQSVVYIGTNANGCPIFSCIDLNLSTENASLYNINTWFANGIAGYGRWSFTSGNETLRSINNSTQFSLGQRTSIGNSAFFIAPATGISNAQHQVDFLLYKPLTLGSYISIDVNYSFNGGSRNVIFRGNNSSTQYQFLHQGNNDLRYIRASIPNGSPSTNQIIVNSANADGVYQKAYRYKFTNSGSGYLTEVFLLSGTQRPRIFSDFATGNISDWTTFITGVSINVTSPGTFSIPSVDRNNYGIFFNNIEYYQAPEVLFACVRERVLSNDPTTQTYRGLYGWGVGLGKVASFSNVMGMRDLQDTNYRKLVQNTVKWLTNNISNPKVLILRDNASQQFALDGVTPWHNVLSGVLQEIGAVTTISNQEWFNYDGVGLTTTNYNIIIPGGNYNWAPGIIEMPQNGQDSIVNFVTAGGAMLTCEWIYWRIAQSNTLQTLKNILPAIPTTPWSIENDLTFVSTTTNSTINNGLPSTFYIGNPENIAGTITHITGLKPGATGFYDITTTPSVYVLSDPFCINYNTYLNNQLNYTLLSGPYASNQCASRCASSSSSSSLSLIQLWSLNTTPTSPNLGNQWVSPSVDINNNGNIIVVGRPGEDEFSTDAGGAWIYTGSSSAGWIFKQKILGDNNNSAPGFFSQYNNPVINSNNTVISLSTIRDNLSRGISKIFTGNTISEWQFCTRITGLNPGGKYSTTHITKDGSVIIMNGAEDFVKTDGVLTSWVSGATNILTGSPINGWKSKQTLTGYINAYISEDSRFILAYKNTGNSVLDPLTNITLTTLTGNSINGWKIYRDWVLPKESILGFVPDRLGYIIAIASGANQFAPNAINMYTGDYLNGWSLAQSILKPIYSTLPITFSQSSNPSSWGRAWALNGNGSVLVVNDQHVDINGIGDVGAFFIYTGDPSSNWNLKQIITGYPNGAPNQYFSGPFISDDANVIVGVRNASSESLGIYSLNTIISSSSSSSSSIIQYSFSSFSVTVEGFGGTFPCDPTDDPALWQFRTEVLPSNLKIIELTVINRALGTITQNGSYYIGQTLTLQSPNLGDPFNVSRFRYSRGTEFWNLVVVSARFSDGSFFNFRDPLIEPNLYSFYPFLTNSWSIQNSFGNLSVPNGQQNYVPGWEDDIFMGMDSPAYYCRR